LGVATVEEGISDLEALLDDAMAHDPSPDQSRADCQTVANY